MSTRCRQGYPAMSAKNCPLSTRRAAKLCLPNFERENGRFKRPIFSGIFKTYFTTSVITRIMLAPIHLMCYFRIFGQYAENRYSLEFTTNAEVTPTPPSWESLQTDEYQHVVQHAIKTPSGGGEFLGRTRVVQESKVSCQTGGSCIVHDVL